MKCPYLSKGVRILLILFAAIFTGGCLFELFIGKDMLMLSGFFLMVIIYFVSFFLDVKTFIFIDEKGVEISKPFQKNIFFEWKDVKFTARYSLNTGIKGVWGIIFSLNINEYDIKNKFRYSEIAANTEKSGEFYTITGYSDKLWQAVEKYVPYSKLVKRELKYEDFWGE